MSVTISSDAVQKLRSQTGAGIMDCKRALATANGDMDKAVQILREQGAASAAKRAGRTTGDGLVTSYATDKTAALVELNCETDFVARTDDFKNLIADLAKAVGGATAPKSAADVLPDRVQAAIAKLGENISFQHFARFDLQGEGLFASYIHPSGGVGKVGVVVEVGASDAKAASNEDVQQMARDLAMQVAATSPRWVKREDVPAELLEQEKNIAREQAKRENKPEKIWDKISTGKLQQFYQQFCLLDQPFVKDAGGKSTVAQYVEQVAKKTGLTLTPRRFVRYKVGEEKA